MWVFTKEGFVSAVTNRDGEGLVVRGRDRRALDVLAIIADVAIAKSPKGDYPYRVFVTKESFGVWLAHSLDGLDYTNFKSKVARTRGPEYTEALHDVWAAMHTVEDADARSGLRFGYIQRPQGVDGGQNDA